MELEFDEDDYAWMTEVAYDILRFWESNNELIYLLIKRMHQHYSENDATVPDTIQSNLFRITNRLNSEFNGKLSFKTNLVSEDNNAIQAYLTDLGKTSDNLKPMLLSPLDEWSTTARSEILAMPLAQRSIWLELMHHCLKLTGAKPTGKWVKTARALIGDIPEQEFKETVLSWIVLFENHPPMDNHRIEWAINTTQASFMTGLVFLFEDYKEPEVVKALSNMAIVAYKKKPQIGVRSMKIGNACMHVISQIPIEESLTQLMILKKKLKSKSAVKSIDKSYDKISETLSISREDAEEAGTLEYGLTDIGKLEQAFGDFTAQIHITSSSSAPKIEWLKADGKTQKSVPAAVKSNHAEELKKLKANAKEMGLMLSSLRERFDRSYLENRSWDIQSWSNKYFQHKLLATIARRLIWNFTVNEQTTVAFWHEDQFVNSDGKKIKVDKNAEVSLWHPIDSTPEEIQAWRLWLESQEIQQPFKQAHREVYLITDAERTTHTYSNRFAAHILNTWQLSAICKTRDWKHEFGMYSTVDFKPPQKIIPQWNLLADFDVTGIVTRRDGVDEIYLSSDRIVFRSTLKGNLDEVQLEQVTPIVFSEVLRDVDLFVGVTSISNDPNWVDGGPDGRFREYWENTGFGEIMETAQTRKETLERLVPRLKIADKCSFEDHFLVVQGQIRTYKIHLGSTNILMTHNNQFLCIVPKGRAVSSIFLPFEGDNKLSVILSKALMLADDHKIKDETILRQINRTN